jgi:hypothetical protein
MQPCDDNSNEHRPCLRTPATERSARQRRSAASQVCGTFGSDTRPTPATSWGCTTQAPARNGAGAAALSPCQAVDPRYDSCHVTGPMEIQLQSARMVERDGLWLDPEGVVGAVLSPLGIFVGWLEVAWAGPARHEHRLRDVAHVTPANVVTDLAPAVARAEQRGQAARRDCRSCGRRYAPGWMHSRDVCHGCAERELGVVY